MHTIILVARGTFCVMALTSYVDALLPLQCPQFGVQVICLPVSTDVWYRPAVLPCSKMMMQKIARVVSLAPVARRFSQAATAGADLGFGFQLSEESRAYVDLARKFTKVRSTVDHCSVWLHNS